MPREIYTPMKLADQKSTARARVGIMLGTRNPLLSG
jgi:hypothetical protein